MLRLDFPDLSFEALFGVPKVIGLLHSKPHIGAVTTKLANPQGHLGRNSSRARKDAVKRLSAYPKYTRGFCNGHTKRRKHVLPQDFTRMNWRPRIISCCHGSPPDQLLLRLVLQMRRLYANCERQRLRSALPCPPSTHGIRKWLHSCLRGKSPDPESSIGALFSEPNLRANPTRRSSPRSA